jgi:hypothetical protein
MPDMYVVDRLGPVHPSVLDVVDDELDVRRDPRRLDRAQIDANDFGFWVFVAH